VFPVGWAVGVLSPELLRTLLTVALAIAVLVEGVRHLSVRGRRMFDAAFGAMLRPHERSTLTGATWLAASMLAAIVLLPPGPAVVALWAVAAGDGAASIAGRLASRARPTAGKTVVGSAACAAVTTAGAVWLSAASWPAALVIGAATALAERPRGPLDDNVRVAFAAGIAAWVLGIA
jgi:dolichol kinase